MRPKATAIAAALLETTEDPEFNRHLAQTHLAIQRPYTPEELHELVDKEGDGRYVTVNVAVDFHDLIHYNLDWFNDYVSEQITGSDCGVQDITYKPVGIAGTDIIVAVTGDVLAYLEQ